MLDLPACVAGEDVQDGGDDAVYRRMGKCFSTAQGYIISQRPAANLLDSTVSSVVPIWAHMVLAYFEPRARTCEVSRSIRARCGDGEARSGVAQAGSSKYPALINTVVDYSV